MILSLVITTLASAPGVALAGPAPITAIHQDDPKDLPDKRPEIEEALDALKSHAKKRGKEDQEAIAVVDTLLQEFPKSGVKDRKAIVKALSGCLKEKRSEVDGRMQNCLYIACAHAMGSMGPESVKDLTGWIDHKQHRKDLVLQAELIRALGRTKDDKGMDPLVDLLTHKDSSNQAAAAEALGNYDEADLKDRKEIFDKILNVLNAAKNRMDSNIEDVEARERYNVIKAPMVTTLQALSGHTETNPDRWRAWWNDNKKKDWDEDR